MIFIGLDETEKLTEIEKYISGHDVDKVIIFSDEHFFLEDIPEDYRQIGYKETIMYRTFYPLLAEINDKTLLVMNEMMRDSNRSCLTYNCVAKFTNQTPHRLVFEYLPAIDSAEDFMILLDFNNSQRYKLQRLEDIDFEKEEIFCRRRELFMEHILCDLPDDAAEKYEKEKDRLFDNLGNKDPGTIPRNLHAWVGRYKVKELYPDLCYVARNSRFKKQNVTTYANVEADHDYILVDIQHSHKAMNDFFRRTKVENPLFISTGLKVDQYYLNEHNRWWKEVQRIYDKTGIYRS